MAQTLTAYDEKLTDRTIQTLSRSGSAHQNIVNLTQHIFSYLSKSVFETYQDETLGKLVSESYDYIARRPANAHKIRAYDLHIGEHESRKYSDVTVVEIINDDMPFLVDSIMGEILERQLEVYQIVHPILKVQRGATGDLQSIAKFETLAKVEEGAVHNGHDAFTKESFIQIHIEKISDQRKRDLITTLSGVLENVRLAVADWRAMLLKVTETIANFTNNPPPVDVVNLAETIQFLKWLTDNHFTFLGIREYELVEVDGQSDLSTIPDSGLGVLRDPELRILRKGDQKVHLSDEIRKFFFAPEPLIITKANTRSVVHRRAYMDYVGIKKYDAEGKICGEMRIIGLFTSSAYTRPPKTIPFIRHKVDTVIRRYGHSPKSHSSKALQNVLDTFPRDELFQISTDRLYEIALGIHELDIQPRLRVFCRYDEFNRFVSVLTYVPRDKFSTEARIAIGQFLAKTFEGRVSAFYPFFPEGQLVRIHYIIGRDHGVTPQRSDAYLENEILKMLRSWSDHLKDELTSFIGAEKAGVLIDRYGHAFPAGYQELTTARQSIDDITHIEKLSKDARIAINFYKDPDTKPNKARISIYHYDGPISLSKRVPILENFGFSVIDERSFEIKPKSDNNLHNDVNLHDMVVRTRDKKPIDLTICSDRLEQAFLAVWHGKAENDSYNELVTKLPLSWREVAMIRALGAYLRQLGVPFTKRYISETLVHHAETTYDLVELFRLRFDPDLDLSVEAREKAQVALIEQIEESLSKIPSLDEDRILRHLRNLLQAMLRTNFYKNDEAGPDTIAFKFRSKMIEAMPEPKPFAEIFVYSPRVEGVHLRGGKIARGGIRWSDRRADFRTEVLGLVKAQQVKNTVIVPFGAKGGFFPKHLPENGTREEIMAEGIASYKLFISSLLTITDNLDGQTVIPPKRVVRHDGDDPYLVVAADKGTATFSDFANGLSQDNHFWMDDAFASGGSAGYDHKKMAITARGAWECVKRHFREQNIDIQKTPFSVIGIGDMSGDVFGNGMLLSKCIKLVAAFDHRDIFIDPNPDIKTSWEERKRMFDLPRSSWQDYNKDLISKGGGIFSRQAKSIPLSEEMKQLTGLKKDNATPTELMHALLQAETDLLWLGGIGTYVRADSQRNEEAGDRANDAIRITASQLKAKVVGEGANLGMTQLARIEFAKRGGRVNTDAIDNSAGVNSSDQEVNIKITTGAAMKAGKLTREARNELLTSMTEEVANACLRNNYLQSLIISLGERRGLADLSFQQHLMRSLETTGLLDRAIENLPTDAEIADRFVHNQPLTRPELAVLLAYAKIDLFDKLVKSAIPDDKFLERELISYFPKTLYERFPDEILTHRLRREIIATQLTNHIINRGGSTVIIRLQEETGHNVETIAYAFVAVSAVFDVEHIYDQIDALDSKVPGDVQLELYAKVQNLLRQQTTWFLRNVDLTASLSDIITTYQKGLEDYDEASKTVLDPVQIDQLRAECARYEQYGVPSQLASHIAGLRFLSDGPDIVLVTKESASSVARTAEAYAEVGKYFKLFELRDKATSLGLGQGDYFDRIAINSALSDISYAQRAITQQVLQNNGTNAKDGFEAWRTNKALTGRVQHVLHEILDSGDLTIAKLTVGVAQLRNLAK